MAGDINLSGYKAAASDVLTTELNSLASTYISALSSEIDNSTNKYKYMEFSVYLASAAFTGTPYVEIYVVNCLDGTNYPDWDSGAAPTLNQQNWYVGRILIKPTTSAKRSGMPTKVLVPNGKFKIGLCNVTGVAFASSGNILTVRYSNDAYT